MAVARSTALARHALYAAWTFVLLAPASGLTQTPAEAPPAALVAAVAPPATLRLVNRDIVTLRATLAGVTPAVRVERAHDRMRQLADAASEQPLTLVRVTVGTELAVQFLLGDEPLFLIVATDAERPDKRGLDRLAQQTETRLREVIRAWHDSRAWPLLLRGLLQATVVSVLLYGLIWTVGRIGRTVVGRLDALRAARAARPQGADWREFFARLVARVFDLVVWFVNAALIYAWLRFVLAGFVLTAPLAREMDGWLVEQLVWVGTGVFYSIPGVVTVVIVLVLTRAVADALAYFFDAVRQRRLRLPFLHSETLPATRRIVMVVVWGLGLAIAYPYLPGSDSDAFKGLSVLFGLMLTLGSGGVVMQAMAGLFVIYSRGLREGDFIEVAGVQGVVVKVSTLATRVINVRNEEITIPHSVLIANPIYNYSKLGGTQGTLLTTKVTIGYDTPWRQVHALLIEAATRTPGVRTDPKPYVYQRSLSNFYVEYELYVAVDEPLRRVGILSALHANVQDCFSEHGVQIMSPHYIETHLEAPVVVPKAQWFAAPARPPAGSRDSGEAGAERDRGPDREAELAPDRGRHRG